MAYKFEGITSNTGKTLIQDADDDILNDGAHYDPYQPPSAPQTTTDDPLIGYGYPIQNQPYSSYPPPTGPPYPPGSQMPPPIHYGQQTHNTTTTIILQQPSQPQVLSPRGWSSSLCECGRDWSICCCGLFCFCCLESEVAQDMGESCLLPCCVPGWLITLRTKMRMQENISGSVMDDCCHVCCCNTCTLCQLAYEIKVVRERQMAQATSLRQI